MLSLRFLRLIVGTNQRCLACPEPIRDQGVHAPQRHGMPLWSDEVWWYSQINSVAKYGMPMGYIGCNETHAAIGTFGFWGGAIVYAMTFFAKIFGWHHWSPLFMNVFYLMLANIVFFMLTKPEKNVALKLAFLNCILFVNIQYMFTGMSECTRFSMAVILSGIFYFLLNKENRNKKSYVIVLKVIAPFFLIFFVNCYIMFSFLFPVYGYILFKYFDFKKYRLVLFILFCFILPLFATISCLFVLTKTSAPYSSTASLILSLS